MTHGKLLHRLVILSRWRSEGGAAYLVEGEAGVIRCPEDGEAFRPEGADGVAAAGGELLTDGVDAAVSV